MLTINVAVCHGMFSTFISAVTMQLKASYYSLYAQQLASSGYAVVQYDTPLLKTPPDAVEVCSLSNSTILKLVVSTFLHSFTVVCSILTAACRPQLGFLPGLLDWLQDQTQDSTSPLQGQLDVKSLGTAGHSRGAKLAALHLTGSKLCPCVANNIMGDTLSPVLCNLQLALTANSLVLHRAGCACRMMLLLPGQQATAPIKQAWSKKIQSCMVC